MKLNPYLAIVIAMSTGGFNGALVKMLDLPATAISFFRMAVPTVVIAIFLLGVQKKKYGGLMPRLSFSRSVELP